MLTETSFGSESTVDFALSSNAVIPGDRVRYIGSKARIATQILDLIEPPVNGRFLDLFGGTGAVSRAAALRGWNVLAVDNLSCAAIIMKGRFASEPDHKFEAFGGYAGAIRILNNVAPQAGPIFLEYSPSGQSQSGDVRKYFTCENARKIDGIRAQIVSWQNDGKITISENDLLIADLLSAANSVANIAGTYGCFLSQWISTSQRQLVMRPRVLTKGEFRADAICGDAFEVSDLEADVIYMDPPYTKRQYAAYYHLLETIAIGDFPSVVGKCGIRSWHEKSSPFCHKRRALKAFHDLVSGKRARRIYISYSSQAHLTLEILTDGLRSLGSIRVFSVSQIARYAPNNAARQNGSKVSEFLIEVSR